MNAKLQEAKQAMAALQNELEEESSKESNDGSDDKPEKPILSMRPHAVEDECFMLVRGCANPGSARAQQMRTERLQHLELLYQAPVEVPVRLNIRLNTDLT